MSNEPPSPNFNRWPTLLLLAVAIFGPPSAIVLTFTHAVTQNPWLTAMLIVAYEVLVFLVTRVAKIWQKLEEPWIEQVAEWIKHRVKEKVSGYQGQYSQHLIYQHRNFDMRGLNTQNIFTLKLEQVFVELRIVPTPAHLATVNPLRPFTPLEISSYNIWKYLTAETLANEHLVILGPPGSGKTTLLKHIVLVLTSPITKSPHRPKIPSKLPVFLSLRDCAQALEEQQDLSLVDAVHKQVESIYLPTMPSEWMERQLTKGQCMILLDGLDEVADATKRQKMVNWVQRQMTIYGQNRFVITSRPLGYRNNPLNGVIVLEVQAFTPEQIQQFLHNWYTANEIMGSQQDDPGVRMKAVEGAKDLWQRIRKAPALLAMAVNPLLLTMIATVHRYRSSLPGKRVALYAEVCEVFLGKRLEVKGITQEISAEQKERVLQVLAYRMMQQGWREISQIDACQIIEEPLAMVSSRILPETFLHLVEETSGLLLEREQGTYGFAHLTFQEYLAATYLSRINLGEVLVEKVGNIWWHETIRLYSAQADATPILQACLSSDHPSPLLLALALECREEALAVQPTVSAYLDNLLEQGIESSDVDLRRVVAEALLTRRLR